MNTANHAQTFYLCNESADGIECNEVRVEEKNDVVSEKMIPSAERFARGDWSGFAPVSPLLPGKLKEGMSCHWQATSRGNTTKYMLLPLALVLHIVASIVYLQYCARKTLDIVTKHPLLVAYQITIFYFEFMSALSHFVQR